MMAPEKSCQFCEMEPDRFLREALPNWDCGAGAFEITANIAKSIEEHRLIWGTTHNVLDLPEEEFRQLFRIGADKLQKVAEAGLPLPYQILYLNAGPPAGGTIDHAHLQCGASGYPFAFQYRINRVGSQKYFDAMLQIHQEVGLAFGNGDAKAYLSLCPLKEYDITVISKDIDSGARLVHRILQHLIAQGMTSYSLAALPRPAGGIGSAVPCHDWPPVVWRLLRRDNVIGTMELFGSTVCGVDPFVAIGPLRAAVESQEEVYD